jgi:uracil-DNA glycosylase family 4
VNPLHPAECDGCPFDHTGGTFVPPDTPTDLVKLVVWGESPGDEESWVKQGFVGRSGKLLRRALMRAGLKPGWVDYNTKRAPQMEVAFRNLVLCKPPGNKFPGQEIAGECMRRHQAEFIKDNTLPWLTTGWQATRLLTDVPPDLGIQAVRGSVLPRWRSKGRVATATLHPAFLLHGAGQEEKSMEGLFPLVASDCERAMNNDRVVVPHVKVHGSAEDYYRAWKDYKQKAERDGDSRPLYSLDIEGGGEEGPSLVGCSWLPGEAHVIRWSEDMVEVLNYMMKEGTPIAHNAAYDLPELKAVGVTPAKFWIDTINMAAVLEPELPKNLQSLVLTHVEGSLVWKPLVSWKHKIDNQPVSVWLFRQFWRDILVREGRRTPDSEGEWFCFYNGLDAAWTLKLYYGLASALGPRRMGYYMDVIAPLQAPLAEQGERGMLADPKRMERHRKACVRLEQRANDVLRTAGRDWQEGKLAEVVDARDVLIKEREEEWGKVQGRPAFSQAKVLTKAQGKVRTAKAALEEGFNGESHTQKVGLIEDWYGIKLAVLRGKKKPGTGHTELEKLISRAVRGTIKPKPKHIDTEGLVRVLRSLIAVNKWPKWRRNYLEKA